MKDIFLDWLLYGALMAVAGLIGYGIYLFVGAVSRGSGGTWLTSNARQLHGEQRLLLALKLEKPQRRHVGTEIEHETPSP